MVDADLPGALDLMPALRRMGLAGPGETPCFTALTGGVSSDIWRVDLATGPVCVKRALPKLRVAADWQAPVVRNLYEARWMRVAAGIVPQAVPALLGQDDAAGALAMAYLAPEDHPVWKAQLRDGQADPAVAAEVGRRLVLIHAATAADPDLAAEFPTDAIFHDIRLEPYLVATAAAHPDCADALHALVETTRTTRRALVHGDVSPKNILCGPQGPVFLDAECAWYGDPAFDLAFCLNHLLLKGLWRPDLGPAIPGLLRHAGRRLSRRRGLGAGHRLRGPRCTPPTRVAAGPGRRQVAGRIPHRTGAEGPGAPGGQAAAAGPTEQTGADPHCLGRGVEPP